ncbi:erythrocyte membrane protein 1, PfEMP1, putative [Plasmodium sp. gorilla clade G2]|uniref:erythrocyte membrane protein 1, PfEMP1, putative n=1 Tax=Plasmodium sp. gorilla clade G2 TaxID=880535 RepID=UPI000D229A65|nr:erythrocyte membrane protein 1, PfEMP1, putative [Plasmodium sp. gorilla clade G2]SOV15267.1 erythrocyte membrane protein 1, PfEMP1, putative [Plasmodium sp. gorilla clade G2]
MGGTESAHRSRVFEEYKVVLPNDADVWDYSQYISFLKKEIKEKKWKDNKYRTLYEKKKTWKVQKDEVDEICAWEEIQKEIFQAVMEKYSYTPYKWEDEAKGLIEKERNQHFNKETCDKFNHTLNEESGIIKDVQNKECNLHTADGLCIPVRRSNFRFDTISNNIRKIMSVNTEKDENKQQRSILAVTSAIGTLTQQLNRNIVSLKMEYQDNKDLCKIFRRTYADYKDIIEGNDIVDNKTSKGFQCLLKETKKHLTEPNTASSLLDQHFKKTVEEQLDLHYIDSGDDKKSKCNLDDIAYTGKPQCLRFLEEWFEDYSKEKERFEKSINEICIEGKTKEVILFSGIKYKIPCEKYCKEYQNILNKGKMCYNKYITECKKNLEKHSKYRDETLYQAEVERIQRETKEKYKCSDDDCGKDGKKTLDAFFNAKKLSTNKIYCCGCINNTTDIYKVFGNNDNESSYIDAMLNKLSICAPRDITLDEVKDGKIMSKGQFTDICSINYGNSNLSGTGTCSSIPCNRYYLKEKYWICDSTKNNSEAYLKNEWSDAAKSACLPPRTQRLCLGRIYSNKCTIDNIENIDTNDKLLTELIIAAKYEGTQLRNKYITHDTNNNRNMDEKIKRLCNAAKYSFADLGDIVKGTSIWENNDMRSMEKNLRIIFGKIYQNIGAWNQDKYKDTDKDGTYKKLREVWWNTNREYIWKALVCGINSLSVNNQISCISEEEPPNIDYMPQFLRWLTEWTSEFCEKRTKMLNVLDKKCELCKDVIDGGYCVRGKCTSNECQDKCQEYTKWIKGEYITFLKQKNKFQNVIKKDKVYKQFGKNDNISSFLSDQLKKGTCNGIHKFDNNDAFRKVPHDCNCNTSLGSVDPNDNKCINPKSPNVCGEINSRVIDDPMSSAKCSGMESDKDMKWRNNNTPDGDNVEGRIFKPYKNIPKGVEISPRRYNLCMAKLNELAKDERKWKEEELKQALLQDAANESYNISKYLKSGAHEQYKVAANNALKYSFLDYKNIIEGTDLIENHIDNGINNMLNKIIGKNGDPTGNRKTWWNKNKDCVRQAMLCGYQEGHKDSGPPNDQLLPYDVDTPQFLYWVQEWYEDFCSKRKQMNKSVEKVCKDNNKNIINYECNKCIEECNKYKEFLAIKKGEWENQKKYYDQHHKSENKKSLEQYLKSKSPGLEGCNINLDNLDFDIIFAKTYGDNESYCACEKYKPDIYNKHSNQDNCKGLLGVHKTGFNWMETGQSDYFPKLVKGVHTSPRRRRLCIQDLDKMELMNKNIIDKKNILREKLLELAAIEGYNIGKYYKEKTNDTNSTKYTYSVKECNALKYSFYDFKNIIVGTDFLERKWKDIELTETEKKLHIVFSTKNKPNNIDTENMAKNRTEFWDKNKKCFWNAMLCGYKKGIDEDNLPDGCNPYKFSSEENTPQFLLWLNEWSEDFYQQRQKQIEELRNTCEECRMNSDQNEPNHTQKCKPKNECKTCQVKCTQYKEWIEKWKDQWGHLKKYYDEKNKDSTFKNYVTTDDLSQYVVKKLKDIGCSNINSFDENDAFVKYPTGFQKVCSCQPTETTSSDPTNHENNCDDNFKSQWNCDDRTRPTINTKMCIRENDSTASNSGSDGDMLFFNSFTQWLDEMSYNMKENTNILSQTCNRKIIGGNVKGKCKECQKNCKCYEEWKKKIEDQWKKQKTYFDKEKKKPDSTMSGIELNEFLHAYCWTKDENRKENECSPRDTQSTIIDEKLEETDINNKNVCGICPDEDTKNKDRAEENCDDTKFVISGATCQVKKYDNIENGGKNNKDWKEATNGDTKIDNIYVPPRRQQLCISYLSKNNNIDIEENLKKYLKTSIMNEIKRLLEYYKPKKANAKPVNSDNNKIDENGLPMGFCKAVERSFADIGDFVKGTNLDYEGNHSPKVKTLLDAFFKGKNEIYRRNWWEQNKRQLWKAVKCGIKEAKSGNNGLDCPQNIDFDRRDQFLRWFEEWGEYICIEHTKNLKELLSECSNCENGIYCGNNSASGSRGTKTCDSGKCTTACGKYKAWIKKRRDQWTKLSTKYNEEKSQYNDDDEATFWAKHMIPSIYLKFFNIDTCSKTFFNKLFYKDFDYGDQQKLCECDKKKHKMQNPDETDIPAPDDITSKPCDVKNEISSCHEKKFDDVLWTSRYIRPQKDGSPMFGVYAPPRRQKLCVGNIWQHATDRATLLNELMLAAKKEGEFLKKYYDQKSGSKGSSGNNSAELCKAITRSFYDLRDIIKGIDLRRGEIVTATEKKIHEIFKKELNGSSSGSTPSEEKILEERKTWWNQNKENVWKAMTCDQTCGTPSPSDTTPQFLRWYEEWYEDFCKNRQKLLGNIQTACSGKKATEPCTDNKECETACSKYSNWLAPKQFEWRAQTQNYQRKKLNEHQQEPEFQNVTKGKNKLEEYLEDMYGSNNGSCKDLHVQKMDEIVVKNDKEYKEMYEPLCSRCRMKKLIDKVNEKKKKKNKTPPSPASTIENICKNGNGVNCKNVTNTGLIKVPFNPHDKDPKKNKENDTIDCGGIPSDTNDIEWVGKDHYKWLPNLDKNIYVSPRRRKLCSHGLDKLNIVGELKTQLLKVAANDAYNVGIKYNNYKNHYGVKPCRALQYSFNDYKHIILGTDNLEPPNNGTETNMKKLFAAAHGDKANAGQPDSPQRQKWWKENKKCVWDVMVCGYKKGKEEANKNNHTGNNIPELTTEEGGGTNGKCEIPDDVDNSDQFLSWLREWYEDFCHIRTKLKAEVENSCNIEKDTFNCKKCNEACKKYQEYMKNKGTQWKGQEIYYSEQHKKSRATGRGYSEKDSKDYMIDKFNNIGSCSDTEVKTNIEMLNTQPYYDVDSHCRCKNFIEDNKYKEISGKNNCKGLKMVAEDTTTGAGIKWKHYDGKKENNYLKHLPQEVHFSSRRENICFKDLDNTWNNVKSKEELRKQLMKVAATEGYNLGEYYKEKKENENDEQKSKKYSYDVAPCNAMNYSFYDFRDIILGYDNLEPPSNGTEKNLKNIFGGITGGGQPGSEDRKKWWESNKECVWDSMKCGYKKGYGTDIQNCDKIPEDKHIGINREDGTNFQFLRWFTEWGEDFCKKKKKKEAKLVQECSGYECTNNNGNKEQCKNACDKYKQFIEEWKPQYLKQSEKYYKDRSNNKYEGNHSVKDDVNSSPQAYEYLEKTLSKICKNGDCKCMNEESKTTSSKHSQIGTGVIKDEKHDDHMPESLDPLPSGYDRICDCANPDTKPTPAPSPGGGISGGGSSAGTKPDGTPQPQPQPSMPSPSGKKYDEENGKKQVSQEEKKYIPTPKHILNCVDEAAYYVGKETENDLDDVKSKLKGSEKHGIYTSQQDGWNNGSSCKIIDTNTWKNDTCDVNGNPFDTKEWECNKKEINVGNQDICLPPRRHYMCTTKLENLDTSKTTLEELFKKVLLTAANEGKHLKDKWEKTEGSQKKGGRIKIKRHELCDAMKYSFADIGDIIRGKDIWSKNEDMSRLEQHLEKIFEKIQQNLPSGNKYASGKDETPKYSKLRSHWWTANRDQVWKAMTCSAADEFQVFKKLKGEASNPLTQIVNRCGHENDPPYDDYIPQRFRWIKEWSENYCNTRKKHLDDLKKECGDCYRNDTACLKNKNAKFCSKCQEQCESYTEMVEKWKTQWKEQEETYNKLYFNRKLDKNYDENHKMFIEKMNEKCKSHAISADIFIEEASNCTNITFEQPKPNPPGQSVSTASSYAFELPPKGYDVLCGTSYRKSCLKLKRSIHNSTCCKKNNLCGSEAMWKKIPRHNIYVPPRTQQLCLKPTETSEITKTTKHNIAQYLFSKEMQESAYNEAKLLYEYYSRDGKENIYSKNGAITDEEIKKHTLEAMKRSYADYGDLIKGTTKYHHNGMNSKINILSRTLGYVGSPKKTRVHLWNKHKSDIWHAMICGYNDANPNNLLDNEDIMCKLPDSDTEEEFLRWFTEWTEDFCSQYEKNINLLNAKCSSNNCDKADNNLIECQEICSKHKAWIIQKKEEYYNQKHRYNIEYKSVNGEKGNTFEFLKNKCKQKCGCISGKANNNDIDKVFEEYPEEHKTKCQCSPDPLNKCPLHNTNNAICKRFEGVDHCSKSTYDNTPSQWGNALIKYNSGHNEGVLLPPRRRHLCLEPFRGKTYKNKQEDVFKKDLLDAVFSEGILLGKKYPNDNNQALQAMKYSFADYGDIIKGTDMVDITTSTSIKTELQNILKKQQSTAQKSSSSILPKDVNEWWKQNKTHVWHAMLCGYKDAGGSITKEDCDLPDDTIPQFLRWLTEWGRQACQEKIKNARHVKNECAKYIHYKDTYKDKGKENDLAKNQCKDATDKYEQWIKDKSNVWEGLNKKYEKDKNNFGNGYSPTTARRYLKRNCPECTCAFEHLEDKLQLNTQSDDDSINKSINRAKMDLPDGGWGIYLDDWKSPTWNTLQWPPIAFPEISWKWIPSIETVLQNVSDQITKGAESLETVISTVKYSSKKTIEDAKTVLDKAHEIGKLIIDILENIQEKEHTPKTKPTEPPPPGTPPQNDQSDITNNILSSTVPVGISFALGSIALLFYLKKKPKYSPVDLVRVIDIPQNDYGIPDKTSTNRYIPYSRYKGKTYIYVEGEETDDYVRDMSSSDITSSSESEYEEIDINDIYGYKSPKYKTLIEVVLKPTKSGETSNSGDIPINKLTDEEWNELKQDFISQYLQNIPKDLPNKNIIDYNMYMEPNIIPDNMEEKPFITSIQDRKLYSDDNEIIYNINWNIPKNITTNTATYNSLYSGIDLINDSLNNDQHIDIYDELLKRKENELFGTNHTKKTNTNSFAKKTNSDPVLNQLDLFDKWLDRHRDMCNEWNNKEEMLHKLKDVWNKENNQHIMNISSTHNDINDEETYNVINTHESNDITFLEHLASTYNTSNDLQTNNLRTNIYMDIHYNENNDIINEEDQLENSYNSS